MSKIWIPAVVLTAMAGAILGVVLSQGEQPAELATASQVAPTQPASSALGSAPQAAVAQVSPPVSQETALAPSAQPPAALPNQLNLWSSDSLSAAEQDGMPIYLTQLDPSLLTQFNLGQTLQLSLPGRASPVRSTLTQTRNSAGTAVWQGDLLDGDQAESLTLVRGQIETHITIATLDGTHTVIVDNQSGKAVITDENELVLRADPNDQVEYDSRELPPQLPPAQG